MSIRYACLTCGTVSSERYCADHRTKRQRAYKVCAERDCPELTLGTRCREHRRTSDRSGRDGSTRAWRKLRAKVLKRDRYVCFYCSAPATHVDHRIPVSAGGSDDPSNLVAACERCNLSKGAGGAPRVTGHQLGGH